jgi:multiple sugar transport system permease protein
VPPRTPNSTTAIQGTRPSAGEHTVTGGGWRRHLSPHMAMLMPAIIALAALSIFPFIYIIYLSLTGAKLGSSELPFVALKNWIHLFNDPGVLHSWQVTLTFGVVGLVVEVGLGLGIALAFYSAPWGRNLFVTLFMLPIFVAPVVTGLLWRFMLNSSYGVYAWILQNLGMKLDVLGNIKTALPAVIAMDVWEWTPLITLIVLAGLQSLPIEPQESARVDGASSLQVFRYVTLPLLSRTLLVALLIRAMDILRYFDTIFITTAGGPADTTKIIGQRLYEIAFRFRDLGYAAAIGLSMLLVTILLGRAFVTLMYRRD